MIGSVPPSMAPQMSWRDVLADGLERLPAPLHRVVPSEQREDLRHWLGRYRPWEEGAALSPPRPNGGRRSVRPTSSASGPPWPAATGGTG